MQLCFCAFPFIFHTFKNSRVRTLELSRSDESFPAPVHTSRTKLKLLLPCMLFSIIWIPRWSVKRWIGYERKSDGKMAMTKNSHWQTEDKPNEIHVETVALLRKNIVSRIRFRFQWNFAFSLLFSSVHCLKWHRCFLNKLFPNVIGVLFLALQCK